MDLLNITESNINNNNPLPYRQNTFEMIIYMQTMKNNLFMPLVPVSVAHMVEMLSNQGCCVVAGRAGIHIGYECM